MKKIISIICLLIVVQQSLEANLEEALEEHKVIPDVIKASPKKIIEINYENNLSVNLGNELLPSETQNAPTLIKWETDCDPGKYFLAMVDPDAPSRNDPKYGQIIHWMVGNIPDSEISKGNVLADYLGPGPPPKTGLHRYVYLIFEQEEEMAFKNVSDRKNFNIEDFATENKLTLIGANFFQAKNKDQ